MTRWRRHGAARAQAAHARRQRDVGPVVYVALAAGRAGHLQRLRDGRGVGAPHAERVPDAVQVRAAPQRLIQAGVDEAQRHAQHEALLLLPLPLLLLQLLLLLLLLMLLLLLLLLLPVSYTHLTMPTNREV